MASSSRRSTTKARKPRKGKKPRRAQFKKQLLQSKNVNVQETPSVPEDLPCSISSTTSLSDTDLSRINDAFASTDTDNVVGDDNSPSSGCCTPKAERSRIPEITTCPPAPRKQRVISNCSLRRRPIAFFAPPDLELFFFFALSNISA